jgi:hypothetical protein
VMGIMAPWLAFPDPGYPRPKSASPVQVSLVPAYNQCTSSNRMHGPPLEHPSCNPPVQSSGQLTVGTPDAFPGTAANSASFARISPILGNPATPADEADVRYKLTLTDVRKRSDLTDYTGQVQLRTSLRILDRYNGPSEVGVGQDTSFSVTVPCTATGSTSVGSNCSINTTADAVLPGVVKETRRSIWQLGQVEVFDGGADGVVSTTPNTLFARQGVFVP